MKISAFYENILDAINYEHLDTKTYLAQLKQDGMEKVYISYETLKNDQEESILKMLQELELGVEGLYGFIFFDHSPLDESYKNMIDLAAKVNAGNVLFVPGFITDEDLSNEKQIKENMWTGLKNAVKYGKEKGVAVSIEDFDGLTAPYCRISGVAEFLENVPGLQFSFDTGNFVMYHDDELEAFEMFKDKICTVHLKDRLHEKDILCDENTLGGKDENVDFPGKEYSFVICADGEKMGAVPVGDGVMQIKEIMSRLKSQGYDGGLIAELYGYPSEIMAEGIRKSVRWIKETWAEISRRMTP